MPSWEEASVLEVQGDHWWLHLAPGRVVLWVLGMEDFHLDLDHSDCHLDRLVQQEQVLEEALHLVVDAWKYSTYGFLQENNKH